MKCVNKKAVSLIILVITIIVMIILASTVIISLSDTDIIGKANEATLKSDLYNIRQAIAMEWLNSEISGENPNYESIIPKKYKDKIVVKEGGRAHYICNNADEIKIAKEAGLLVIDKTSTNLIKDIQTAVEEYKLENNSSKNVNLMVTQYIRNLSYSGGSWNTVAGEVDENMVQYVNTRIGMTSDKLKEKIKYLEDPVTGEKIDFIHAIASLNGYLYNKENSELVKIAAEYSAWAGDLCTLMKQVVEYTIQKSYTAPYTEDNKADIEKYIEDMLGTSNTASTFGISDMLADADAAALYTLLDGEKKIADVIDNYYYGEFLCEERYSLFDEYLEDLSTRAPFATSVTKITEPKAKAAYLFMGKNTNIIYTAGATTVTDTQTMSALSEDLSIIIANKFAKYIENNM